MLNLIALLGVFMGFERENSNVTLGMCIMTGIELLIEGWIVLQVMALRGGL